MSSEAEPENRSLTLPTLIVSISSIDPPGLIISMSLIEIAAGFGVSVGLAGQIRSIGSVLAIAVALAMGVLSVRYSYKTLLLDSTTESNRGEQVGFSKMVVSLGNIAGPVTGGLMIDFVSLQAAFVAAGLIGVSGVIFSVLLGRTGT